MRQGMKLCSGLRTICDLACVAWRFWLGALSNKGGLGQRNREEIQIVIKKVKFKVVREYIPLFIIGF